MNAAEQRAREGLDVLVRHQHVRPGGRSRPGPLERLVRTGPIALRPTLPAPIADLEWTAEAVLTALRALQDPTVSAADGPGLRAARDSQPHTPSWAPLPE
jgi:hypothetical protein